MSLDFWPDLLGAEEPSGVAHDTEVADDGQLVAEDARPVADPYEDDDYRDER